MENENDPIMNEEEMMRRAIEESMKAAGGSKATHQ